MILDLFLILLGFVCARILYISNYLFNVDVADSKNGTDYASNLPSTGKMIWQLNTWSWDEYLTDEISVTNDHNDKPPTIAAG
jgi:hypothetical protein